MNSHATPHNPHFDSSPGGQRRAARYERARHRWLARVGLAAALAGGSCSAYEDGPREPESTIDDGVVGGSITWERPEVGTIFVGGGMCTATLVGPRVVVSAAHCVSYATRSSPGNYGTFHVRRAEGERSHTFTIERYRSFGTIGRDDVAILRLASDVPDAVARPTALGSTHPPDGESLSLYGYGCTRRGTSLGSGQKRRLDFRQGMRTTNLCPGDSGGPVILAATGAVLRVNSGYYLDSVGNDIYGDVAANYSRIVEQIRAWGDTFVPPEGGIPGGGADGGTPSPGSDAGTPTPPSPPPPPGSACGRYDGWTIWTCIDSTTRVRCVSGRLERETCSTSCESRPPGVDDVCAPSTGGSCGPYAGWNVWSCIDRYTRVRCIAGRLERDHCTHQCVVRPPGIDDYCYSPGATSCGRFHGFTTWTCNGYGERVRCPSGSLERERCASGCISRPPGVDDECAGSAPTPPPPASDSGTAPSPDAGARPPTPSGDVMWTTWPAQHSRTSSRWGTALTDIVQHLPLSYGDTYADSDLVTYGHETSHGIHAHVRNAHNRTGRRANAFYVLGDRAAIVFEPAMRKSQIAAFVPASLRGSRFALYLTGQLAWDDTPLYVLDEWNAYVNGSEVAVGLSRAGLWTYGWRDAVAGTLEFCVYALATAMATEVHDAAYFRDYPQFRAFVAWNLRRSMQLYREGSALPQFRWDTQDRYYTALRSSPDAAALRDFARRVFGTTFTTEVFGF